MMPTVSVYVPARLNSQRLRRKALADFNGVPLVSRILSTLKLSQRVTEFRVNTDSEEIAAVAQSIGVGAYMRDPALCEAATTTEEILADFARSQTADYVAAINPTNPLLSAQTIDCFFDQLFSSDFDTAFSVTSVQKHVLLDGVPLNYRAYGPHPRTQDCRPVAILNWAIVAWRTELVKRLVGQRGDSIYLGKVGFVEIPVDEATDIDDEKDLVLARALDTARCRAAGRPEAGTDRGTRPYVIFEAS